MLRRALGLLLALLGVAAFLAALSGFIDPVSAKLADDADPFGTPSSSYEYAVGMVISIVVAIAGVYLAFRGRAKSKARSRTPS